MYSVRRNHAGKYRLFQPKSCRPCVRNKTLQATPRAAPTSCTAARIATGKLRHLQIRIARRPNSLLRHRSASGRRIHRHDEKIRAPFTIDGALFLRSGIHYMDGCIGLQRRAPRKTVLVRYHVLC
jgi:hypothetical protein